MSGRAITVVPLLSERFLAELSSPYLKGKTDRHPH